MRRGRRPARRRSQGAFVLGMTVALVGCPGPDRPGPGADDGVPADEVLPGGDAGSVSTGGGGGNAPERFGFGTAATPARIALWDVDVRPDGAGLPPGSGSVAEGERLFAVACAACHGATGIEGPNDRLVGTEPWGEWPVTRTVGNYWPYATTLYDYIRKAMPQNAPGSLSAEETYGVIAYLLHLNGLLPADAVLDATTLPQVVMPARDRFVTDDRRGGPEIR